VNASVTILVTLMMRTVSSKRIHMTNTTLAIADYMKAHPTAKISSTKDLQHNADRWYIEFIATYPDGRKDYFCIIDGGMGRYDAPDPMPNAAKIIRNAKQIA
jgi:hypothetical protein